VFIDSIKISVFLKIRNLIKKTFELISLLEVKKLGLLVSIFIFNQVTKASLLLEYIGHHNKMRIE
jgi:hypothetical protein